MRQMIAEGLGNDCNPYPYQELCDDRLLPRLDAWMGCHHSVFRLSIEGAMRVDATAILGLIPQEKSALPPAAGFFPWSDGDMHA